MRHDIVTVARKELWEALNGGGGRGKWNLLFSLLVFGGFMPVQMGRTWIESPVMALFWLWAPLFLVIQVATDSFAGERERHTLETLLASRLSDRAILFGKLGAAIVYGCVFTALYMIISVIAVNVFYWDGQVLVYSPAVSAGLALVTLGGVSLIAGLSALVSLRAATVKRAMQGLMIALAVPVMAFSLLTFLIPGESRDQFFLALFSADVTGLMFVAGAVLLGLVVVVVLAALARFRRARMILD